MDIIRTEDRSVSTETVGDKDKSNEDLNKSVSCSNVTKAEKKNSENKKLKKRLTEIEQQNESLTKLINEKSTEIVDLKKSINSLNEILNSVPINELRCNSSIASAKLLDLSKKNRQLKSELEAAKNRVTKKDHIIKKLEKDLKKEQEKSEQNKESSKNSNPAYIEEMQNKVSALQQKLFETRNKNVELNTQLKLAQKCLQQEIGESFNLNLLAGQANSSSWRGRAQQILNLQLKIKELQERLDGNKHNEMTNEAACCYLNPPLVSSSSFGSIDRPSVRKTEIQHRAKVEGLEKEIVNLKAELEEQRSKILALKVRNKTLNDEIARYKLKANSMEEQTDFNNFNVAIMNERLSQQKSSYEKLLDESSRKTEKLLQEMKEMELNKQHLEEKVQEFEKSILEKDKSIEELNLRAKKLEEDLKAICGDFLFSCRDFSKEEFIAILDSLETEKNSLLDLNKTLNDRLAQERLKNENLFEQVSKQKIRISRLEAKLRDLERELDVQAEKKKRSQRIAEYTANLATVGSNTSLGSFTFENTSTLNNNNTNPPSNENLNDLKYRLELTNEKITMLKEKLDYVKAEKDDDLKTFHEIISNSKNAVVKLIFDYHQSDTARDSA